MTATRGRRTLFAALLTLTALPIVGSGCSSKSSGGDPEQRRNATAQKVLGWSPPAGAWHQAKTVEGTTWQAVDKAHGIVTVDGGGTTVLSAVIVHAPIPSGATLDEQQLVEHARSFASARVERFEVLQLYQQGYTNRGVERIFTATWRERRGAAWLPRLATVGVQVDGNPIEYGYNPTTVGSVSTTPRATAAAAEAAVSAAHPGATLMKPTELVVIKPPTRGPQLVWVVTVNVGRAPTVASPSTFEVDAGTGSVLSP